MTLVCIETPLSEEEVQRAIALLLKERERVRLQAQRRRQRRREEKSNETQEICPKPKKVYYQPTGRPRGRPRKIPPAPEAPSGALSPVG